MKRSLHLLLLLSLLISCAPAVTQTPAPPVSPTVLQATPTPQQPAAPWWREAIFYEIFVRSFADSNGDGIGDFNGITQKLDYLQSLGVTALWLMPIYPSPSYHGYDVLNFYAVNPQYGTINDFKRLLSEAHGRGIHVILDFVPNHTSSQHPFFQAAQNPQSPYRNYYIWSITDPAQTGAYGGAAWHKTESGYSYGLFSADMPDLNYENPAVTAQTESAMRFWLDLGVDGFRLDAIKHLIEADGKQENTPATHDWLKDFYAFYKSVNPQAYTVGEVYGAGGTLIKAYSGQMDEIFNFELASGYLNSAKGKANSSVVSAIKFTQSDAANGNYASFLTNHDQTRVMSVLGGKVAQAKVAAALLLTGPGTPFLYYGEEIGMTGQKPDEMIRTPMQWDASANAGFSAARPWEPVNSGYETVNAASEAKDPTSLLNYYRALLKLRSEHAALRTGSLTLLETGSPFVYAILRQSGSETLLVVVNLSADSVTDYKLSGTSTFPGNDSLTTALLFGSGQPAELKLENGQIDGYVPFTLEPFTTYVLQLGQ